MWCASVKKNEDVQVIKEHQSHILRLSQVKARVNTNPPKKVMHLKYKLKAKAIRQLQENTINSENKILLQKMTEINLRNHKIGAYHEDLLNGSLNTVNRSQRIAKITEENLQLLDRLQSTKSRYDFKKLDKDFQYKKYLCQKLSENSRRIPRIASFAQTISIETSKSPISRPATTTASLKRPSSSTVYKASHLTLDF